MFNTFVLSLTEQLHGKKIAVILSDATGVTERTWRNRSVKGWESSEVELKENSKRQLSAFRRKLQDGGYSEVEANHIIARHPSVREARWLPTAGLIFDLSLPLTEEYDDVVSIATEFDRLCFAIKDAYDSEEILRVQSSLIDASKWLLSYCPEDLRAEKISEFEYKIRGTSDLDALKEHGQRLGVEMVLHVLSCWDLNFCSVYFGGKFQAYPLFELVMPRVAPNIDLISGSGQFVRNGKGVKSGHFQKSIFRFFDFLGVLFYWLKFNQLPSQLPSVKEIASWCNESERRIVNWRDETTRFTHRDLETIFRAALGTNDKKPFSMPLPSPLLVAALIWSPLLRKESDGRVSLTLMFDDYSASWSRNLTRLKGKGLKFGEIPLPPFLTDQPEGNRSPEL